MGEPPQLLGATGDLDKDVPDTGRVECLEAFADLVGSPKEGVLFGVGVSENVGATRRVR